MLIRSQSGQIVPETLSWRKPNTKKDRWSGSNSSAPALKAEVLSSNPWYWQKKKSEVPWIWTRTPEPHFFFLEVLSPFTLWTGSDRCPGSWYLYLWGCLRLSVLGEWSGRWVTSAGCRGISFTGSHEIGASEWCWHTDFGWLSFMSSTEQVQGSRLPMVLCQPLGLNLMCRSCISSHPSEFQLMEPHQARASKGGKGGSKCLYCLCLCYWHPGCLFLSTCSTPGVRKSTGPCLPSSRTAFLFLFNFSILW
jgi:hypothetical protein